MLEWPQFNLGNNQILKLLTLFTKLFHWLPPEFSHFLALKGLKLIVLIGFRIKKKESVKKISVLNLKLSNKLGLAAGLDKNGDYIDCFSSLGFGFIEIGTVTPKAQLGNPKPRLFRIRSSKALVNKMGFNNKGVDYLISNLKNKKTDITIGISIGKNFDTPNELAYKDYITCLDKIYEFADYIAINISSPNTEGLRNLEAKKELNNLLSKIKHRQLTLSKDYGYKPLFLKISPDNDEERLRDICEVVKELSIDGMICTNTTVNHNFASGMGGMSGRPLRELSVKTLKFCREHLKNDTALIASGGVMTSQDYYQKIEEGADLVQIYTGFIYSGPKLIEDILSN